MVFAFFVDDWFLEINILTQSIYLLHQHSLVIRVTRPFSQMHFRIAIVTQILAVVDAEHRCFAIFAGLAHLDN
jgi:hypothetical protein